MFKAMILGAAIVMAAAVPTMAGSGGCDDQDMWTKSETDINAMPAGPEKEAALADWKMATDFKAAKNILQK